MPKMVTAFDGAEALQQCVWKYHDLPSQYEGLFEKRSSLSPSAFGLWVQGAQVPLREQLKEVDDGPDHLVPHDQLVVVVIGFGNDDECLWS